MRSAVEAVIRWLGFGFLLLAGVLIVMNVLLLYRYASKGHGPSSVVLVPSILGLLGLRLLAWDDFPFFLRYALVIIALDFGPLLLTAAIFRLFRRS